jgi:hypothetical protein
VEANIPSLPAEFVAWVFGFILSILLEVLPVLQDWWNTLPNKKLWTVLANLIIGVVAWALHCFVGLALPFEVTCTVVGLLSMLWLILFSIFGTSFAWEAVTHRLSQPRERNGE